MITTLLQRLPMGRQLQQYQVWGVWREAVGETVARHAWPSKIQKGLLFVHVSDSMWMQELQFLKEMVKEKINRRVGEPVIKDIFFVLGRSRRERGEEREVRLVRRQEPFVELTLPPLDNDKLKEAFSSLLSARRRSLKEEDVT